MRTESTPSGTTYEGAPGYKRSEKTDLFLRATGSFAGEDTFYEKAENRDDIVIEHVRDLAVSDPMWVHGFLTWLRAEGNARTMPVMLAAEAVHARLKVRPRELMLTDVDQRGFNRRIIDAVLQRPDEPGELLAYWMSRHGRNVPQPVKRGVADAVRRLYSERSLLKYDTDSKGFRFGDVLELTHPSPDPAKSWQGVLFKHAIDRRHGHDDEIPEVLWMLNRRENLMAVPVDRRRELLGTKLGRQALIEAGMTWEALAGWLQGPMDKLAWESIIPSMGYMALLRNLRNFDEAGVSDDFASTICAKLADPNEVARSRQLPFRFYSAYKNAPGLRWGHHLEKALNLCAPNVPELPGRTLVLVDTSGSMQGRLSSGSSLSYVEAAGLFGAVLKVRNGDRADLRIFADNAQVVTVQRGSGPLRIATTINNSIGRVGHGTRIAASVQQSYAGHDRVVILTDMQSFPSYSSYGYGGYSGYGIGDVSNAAPAHVPIYAFNVAGYSHSAMPSGSGNRHDLGGLTDHTFKLIPLIEAGESGRWPWELEA